MPAREREATDSDDASQLVDMKDPESVFDEVRTTASMAFVGFDFKRLRGVFDDILRLFNGDYPGYLGCSTEYHDLFHTTDAFLAVARLLHGLHIEGRAPESRVAELCLISALMHDTGYIKEEGDAPGTGAKYTSVHVERSVDFARNYFERNGFPREDYETCSRMISATDLNTKVKSIPFASAGEEMAAKALLAADLLGQMADRDYLEKLLFLYKELKEAGMMGLESEKELLAKTLSFYGMVKLRLETEMGHTERFMRNHFRERWGIDADLYTEAVEKNIRYLELVLEKHGEEHRKMLNRSGIVKRLSEEEGG